MAESSVSSFKFTIKYVNSAFEMRVQPFYLLLLLAAACRDVEPLPGETVGAAIAYEDTVYCFNQRSIVSLDGRKGMMDDSGNIILVPEWDSVEFLDDEVALLSRAGLWYLCTRDGRVFADGLDKPALELSFRERLAEMRNQDYRYWESVIGRLETLGAACLASPRRRPDEHALREYAALQDLLKNAVGTPTRDQQERLSQLEERFISLRRK